MCPIKLNSHNKLTTLSVINTFSFFFNVNTISMTDEIKNSVAILAIAYRFSFPKLGNTAILKNEAIMIANWLHNNARNTLLIRVFSFVKLRMKFSIISPFYIH